jgi:hypothetical protein
LADHLTSDHRSSNNSSNPTTTTLIVSGARGEQCVRGFDVFRFGATLDLVHMHGKRILVMRQLNPQSKVDRALLPVQEVRPMFRARWMFVIGPMKGSVLNASTEVH